LNKNGKLTKEELLRLLRNDVTGLIAGLEVLDEEVFAHSRLKVISRCGSGTSNIDMTTAERLGIKVFSTPDVPVESVAELTVGVLLCMARGIFSMNEELHQGKWQKRNGIQIKGKTVAVIGCGRIGHRVMELLQPFGVRLLAVDPIHSNTGIRYVGLRDALCQADIVTIHSSGEEQILGDNEFACMKSGVLLLNGARGSLINERALIRALNDKIVAGVWLDCFSEEPYKGSLLQYPQAVLTPHIGSYTIECRKQMELLAVENLIAGLEIYAL
jgi:D-3-phosphoglycerate dehydrogenase